MAIRKRYSSIGRISNYKAYGDMCLVCRKTLHTSEINTPQEHSHQDFYELVTVASGSAVHNIGNRNWPISAGSVFLIQPHEKHNYVKYENLLIYNLLFSQAIISQFLPDLSVLPGYQLLFNMAPDGNTNMPGDGIRIAPEVYPEVMSLLEEMDALNSRLAPGDKTLLICSFIRVMFLLSRHCYWSGNSGQMAYVDRLVKLLSELEKNYRSSWSLEKMALFCTMSVSGFRQAFRKYTGSSPIDYLLKLRLAKAADMLSNPHKSLNDISTECGFNDVNYFSRQFKRHYDILPSKCRIK